MRHSGNAGMAAGEGDEQAPPVNQRLPHGKQLPGYGVEYFNQLVAQYLTLPQPALDTEGSVRARRVADAIIAQQEARLNWGDVSGLEMALLRLLPDASLSRIAWYLRARYRNLAGQPWMDLYVQSHPPGMAAPEPAPATPPPAAPDAGRRVTTGFLSRTMSFLIVRPALPEPPSLEGPAAPPSSALRADLEVLLSELQRLRSMIVARENRRNAIVNIGAVGTLTVLILALVFFFVGGNLLHIPAPGSFVVPGEDAADVPTPGMPNSFQVLMLVIAAGALGGLISMLRRLQSVTGSRVPLLDAIELDMGQAGIFLSPVYGSVFAVVLYLFFLGAMASLTVGGANLFPDFSRGQGTLMTWADMGKLLVWSFAAGFAEKFVPDVLDRLVAEEEAVPDPRQASETGPGKPPAGK